MAEARERERARLDVWRLEDGNVSLDIWLESSEPVETQELTQNVLAKLDRKGRIVGVEIVELEALNREDIEALPFEAKRLLHHLARRLAEVVEMAAEEPL